uniref:Protein DETOXIFICATION 9-like n=1 Tax=Nicotiana tabacum TaxID=4097 RepID=A0A1S4D931_TOBAC|nr:PREDICTED: protein DETOXIFICATION 9-like [Nicotiana tabacum]
MAIGSSYWLNVILLVIYLKYSTACQKIRPYFSKDVFLILPEFFQFTVPSAGMVCLRWWAVELITLLSGLLPNPHARDFSLQPLKYISIFRFLSVLLQGAGNPKAARLSIFAVFVLATAEFLLASAILFSCRSVWGYAFTNEKEVITLITELTPLLCLSIVMDSIQTVLSGY